VKAAHPLYVVRVTPAAGLTRDAFLEAVQAQGIGLGVHFRAVHLHPYYSETFGFRRGMYPVAEAAGDEVVSLPLYPGLLDGERERVIHACESAGGSS
jgi:dTDP-4-amino-4,6-dideoxygalactose transaminase